MANLREVAQKALEIIDAHADGAYYDAGFDAGEFSGPAHGRAEEQEITQLARVNGLTFDEVMTEVHMMDNDLDYIPDFEVN